ncbi:MAG: calcium/sodium antiporter [Trueperaceae bacterium]
MSVLYVVVGIVLLFFGGDRLVRGAVSLAARLRVRPMVVGLTVVAFGTSAPELAASITAAMAGAPELAVGNVIGSNVANVGLILGLTALVWPLAADGRFIRVEVPIMLGITVLALPLLVNGVLARWEGFVLLAALAAFLVYAARSGSALTEEASGALEADPAPLWVALAVTAAGGLLLWLGARLLVLGAVDVAAALGVPDRVIGLTMVAIGTSLPELASSIVAALKRQSDIVLGNIVGSNIFNLLAVLGATAVIHPIGFDAVAARVDLVAMTLFSVAVVPMMWRNDRLGRTGGSMLLLAYAMFVTALFT